MLFRFGRSGSLEEISAFLKMGVRSKIPSFVYGNTDSFSLAPDQPAIIAANLIPTPDTAELPQHAVAKQEQPQAIVRITADTYSETCQARAQCN